MNYSLAGFALRLLIYTLIISLLGAIVFYFFLPGYYQPVFPFLVIFYYALTLLFHYFIFRGHPRKSHGFFKRFMLATVLKLFILLVFLITYLLLARIQILSFAVVFFILYVFYSAWEVSSVLGIVKNKS